MPIDKFATLGRRLLEDSLVGLPKIQKEVVSLIAKSPHRSLHPESDAQKSASNQPLRVDKYAEDAVAARLSIKFPKVTVIGEESLKIDPSLANLTDHDGVLAVVDIIDGTDLLLRGLSNWCSAISFFCAKPQPRILAAHVCDHEGKSFFAHCDDSAAFIQRKPHSPYVRLSQEARPRTLHDACIRVIANSDSGPSVVEELAQSSVSFYGQRPSHLFSAFTRGFQLATAQTTQCRIYNLGGIPMMLKVANGTMDGLFRRTGAKPHDFVAGAFIAIKAGAVLRNLSGEAITETDLANCLLTPDSSGPPYVLTGTEELNRALRAALMEE